MANLKQARHSGFFKVTNSADLGTSMGQKPLLKMAPPSPTIGFSLAITGHRQANAAFAANQHEIESVFANVLSFVDKAAAETRVALGANQPAPIRLQSLLVDGFDQIAARHALARQWQLVAPLPFGRALNTAINSHPIDSSEAQNLINGKGECSNLTLSRAAHIQELMAQAHCFELADQDDRIAALFIAKITAPEDIAKAQAFSFAASQRVVMAAQVMIEQSDLMIGVWDGESTSFSGGTGHTIELALTMGTPVLWINAHTPQNWRFISSPEELVGLSNSVPNDENREAALAQIVVDAMQAKVSKGHDHKSTHLEGLAALENEKWKAHSTSFWHGYRRVEAFFSASTLKARFKALRQIYEAPSEIAAGSARPLLEAARALPGQDQTFVSQIEEYVFRRFAWADGISSKLSDTYRGGMVLNFLFSALAIVGGMAYLPFATSHEKWIFALFELVLLIAILTITTVGQKQRWHGRWFETRRVAEYLRLAPILLLLGVARPAGRWPKGTHTSWPEHYVRHSLREVGLPKIAATTLFLQTALNQILLPYVKAQTAYHHDKAKRLAKVHHRLDQMAELYFKLAVTSVSGYLFLKLGGLAHVINPEITAHFTKLFTFLGVLFPTCGGAIAGIRYFGDFERFSAISDVTAQRLEGIAARINVLLEAPSQNLTYAHIADLARATDDVVIAEIESWQAVFSGKHIAVPV
jgi:hypothetical protein